MPGGGSKPGERRGGRKKGTANKANADIIARLRAEFPDWDPLRQQCLTAQGLKEEDGQIVPDIGIDPARRDKAAQEVSQYFYPKRKAIEHSGSIGDPVRDALVDAIAERMLRDRRSPR